MMNTYKIAGILFEVYPIQARSVKCLGSFKAMNQKDPDVKLYLSRRGTLEKPKCSATIEDQMEYYINDNDCTITLCIIHEDKVVHMLQVNKSWSQASIITSLGYHHGLYKLFLGPFGEIIFRNRILFHQGIVIHASAILWKEKGILFSAPSGTGKTTQANLWKQHKGARVLNGDRPAIRIQNELPYVYGTPWSGSSPEYLNKHVILSAIIMLEQDKENSIVRLNDIEATTRLLPRCFLPFFDSELMNLALFNIEKILEKCPVFLLRCRTDKEAVEMVYQCVK